jgi:hypothetical protein
VDPALEIVCPTGHVVSVLSTTSVT